MAKQTDTQITGTFGDYIYYERNGKFYKRAKGNTGRQAEIAKKQSATLGKASAISAKIRAAVKPILPDPANRKLMYRLNRSLQQWLRSEQHHTSEPVNFINDLNGFSFSGDSEINDFGVAMPVIRKQDEYIAVQVPAFDSPNPIHPLPFDGHIRLDIIVNSTSIEDPSVTTQITETLDFPYHGDPVPARELSLDIKTRKGHLTVVCLSVNKITSGIIGALYN